MKFNSKKTIFSIIFILCFLAIFLSYIFISNYDVNLDFANNDKSSDFDFNKLHYYESSSIEELMKINDGEELYYESNLFLGKISNDKVNDVYDVIAQLNILKDVYGFNDSRFEFIPGMYVGDNSYRLHQVYNGVEVWCAQTNVVIDKEGYICGMTVNYIDGLEKKNISTEPKISEKDCKNIVKQYSKGIYYNFGEFYLSIWCEKEPTLMYTVNVTIDNKDFDFWINAISGEIISVNELYDRYD